MTRLGKFIQASDREIFVAKDVLREDAKAVLADYKKNGGLIYSPHRRKV